MSQDSDLAPLTLFLPRVFLRSSHQDIRARSAAWKTESVRSTEAGSRPENVRKNRYKDVVPCKSGVGWGPRRSRCPHPVGSRCWPGSLCPAGFPELSPSQSLAVAAFLPSIAPVHLDGIPQGVPSPAGFHLGGHQGPITHKLHVSHLLLADDQTRVILSLLQEEGHGDYINGNFIRVRLGVRKGAEAVEVTAEPR